MLTLIKQILFTDCLINGSFIICFHEKYQDLDGRHLIINQLKIKKMNNSRIKWLSRSIIVISIFAATISSCKKDDPDPEYVGSWATTQAVFNEDVILQIKNIMTFTTDSYTDLTQVLDEATNEYIDYFKLFGALTVDESIMHIDIDEIGLSSVDVLSGKPTGTIVMYKEGTPQFDNIFSQTGQSQTFGFEFSISGNTMTVYSDYNSDGDYLDEDEAIVYTRQ